MVLVSRLIIGVLQEARHVGPNAFLSKGKRVWILAAVSGKGCVKREDLCCEGGIPVVICGVSAVVSCVS